LPDEWSRATLQLHSGAAEGGLSCTEARRRLPSMREERGTSSAAGIPSQ
jgi:hypothetical protein